MRDYYYDPYEDEEDSNEMALKFERTKRNRNRFVKVKQTIFQMQRPHLDADALISRMSVRGIRAIKKAVVKHRNTHSVA